jgi:hydrogenase maturation protein HypF
MRVRGVVQGVGFRPAMVRLARRTGVGGFVRNDSEGVWIEVEGHAGAIESFVASVRRDAPPLARIESVEIADLAARG